MEALNRLDNTLKAAANVIANKKRSEAEVNIAEELAASNAIFAKKPKKTARGAAAAAVKKRKPVPKKTPKALHLIADDIFCEKICRAPNRVNLRKIPDSALNKVTCNLFNPPKQVLLGRNRRATLTTCMSNGERRISVREHENDGKYKTNGKAISLTISNYQIS